MCVRGEGGRERGREAGREGKKVWEIGVRVRGWEIKREDKRAEERGGGSKDRGYYELQIISNFAHFYLHLV